MCLGRTTVFAPMCPVRAVKEATMILVRDVFQAKYGRGGELVELFKANRGTVPFGFSPTLAADCSQ
jgi:hypothetical protein